MGTSTPPRDWAWGLVAAAQAGDRSAFGELYGRYAGEISRFFGRRVGADRGLVEDLTQETFLRAWRRVDTVSDQGRDVGAWFTTIARNLLGEHHRKVGRHPETLTDELPEPRHDQAAGAGADVEVMARFERAAAAATVRDALAARPAAQRQVVQLYDLPPGRRMVEVAAELGRSEVAARELRSRALRAMSRQLAARGVSSSGQCSEAVAAAGRAVRQLQRQPVQAAGRAVSNLRAGARRELADRWAAGSVAAEVGSEVGL